MYSLGFICDFLRTFALHFLSILVYALAMSYEKVVHFNKVHFIMIVICFFVLYIVCFGNMVAFNRTSEFYLSSFVEDTK